MSNCAQINLHYEELTIKLSASPGWKLVPVFVNTIFEMQMPFQGWTFAWDSKAGYYVKIRKFNTESKYVFLSSLSEFMKKDAICIIKTLQKVPFEILTQHYSKVSEGTIKDNQKSSVFPAPIEIDDWAVIGEEELVMVIHHDGDPLFFLKKELDIDCEGKEVINEGRSDN